MLAIVSIHALDAHAQCSNVIPLPPGNNPWHDNCRPATECELKFYRSFHSTIWEAAIGNVQQQFPNGLVSDRNGGEEDKMHQFKDGGTTYNLALWVDQKSEKGFFKVHVARSDFSGSFEKEDPDAQKRMMDLITEFGKNGGRMDGTKYIAASPTDPGQIANRMERDAIQASTHFEVFVNNVNEVKDSCIIHNGKIELIKVNGAAFAVRITKDKNIKNLEEEGTADRIDETRIYIGKWKTPVITNQNGVQKLVVLNNFNQSQPKLSLQNMEIVIKCDPSLADEVIPAIGFDKLNSLIMP